MVVNLLRRHSTDVETARRQMVEEHLIRRGITDPRVLLAMSKVPRHCFVEPALQGQAYGDHPLPIGMKQTISQPYMVGLMTQLLELRGRERVLEIGAGSGYQTAVLAELAERVYAVERVKSLATKARQTIESLGYHNVMMRIFDGTYGWREEAPFDAILCAAAAPEIPSRLVEQLAEPGVMVLPIGDDQSQTLVRVLRREGKTEVEEHTTCVFVKLIGEYAWKE